MIIVERAWLEIDDVLATRRERFRRFQDYHSSTSLIPLNDATCQLHLNPASRWVRLPEDPASGDVSCPSRSVLFFLVGQEIRGLHMTLEGQALINELADYQPCDIVQWASLSRLAGREQLRHFALHLAEIGLVAWDAPDETVCLRRAS